MRVVSIHHFAVLMINYGMSNTIVLEIPYFTIKTAICYLIKIDLNRNSRIWILRRLYIPHSYDFDSYVQGLLVRNTAAFH